MLLRDMGFIAVVAGILFVVGFFRPQLRILKGGAGIAILPALFSALHIICFGFSVFLLPVYFAGFSVLLLYYMIKSEVGLDTKSYWKWVNMAISAILVAISLIPVGLMVSGTVSANYASLGYGEAFKNLNNYLSQNYAFKEWKQVDFEEKEKEYLPLFEAAQSKGSPAEYYIALNKYLQSFNDGHMEVQSISKYLTGKQSKMVNEARGQIEHYDYGFTLARTRSGSYLAILVDPERETAQGGMKNGSIVTKINGIDIEKVAYAFENPVWYLKFPVKENEDFVSSYYLGTSLGPYLTVSFLEGTTHQEKTVEVKESPVSSRTYIEGFNLLYGIERMKSDESLKAELLENQHGYISLKDFKNEDIEAFTNQFKEKILYLKQLGAKDLIIDIRNNTGGYDELGAALTGLFAQTDQFYLTEKTYDGAFGQYKDNRTLIAYSHPIGFENPVVVLFNCNTISAAEGFAYNMGELEQVTTAGLTKTNGSFGSVETGVIMPENLFISYPSILCANEKGEVLIDSDENRSGGVAPELDIPMDSKAVDAIFIQKIDYELEYVKECLEKNRR